MGFDCIETLSANHDCRSIVISILSITNSVLTQYGEDKKYPEKEILRKSSALIIWQIVFFLRVTAVSLRNGRIWTSYLDYIKPNKASV